MTPQRHIRTMELLEASRDLDPEERAELLERECRSDPTLREELRALLCMGAGPAMSPGQEGSSEEVRSSQEAMTNPWRGSAEDDEARLPLPSVLGPYRLIRLLGKGGMGQVHLAEDRRLLRQVALKVLPGRIARSPERRARFEREAKAAARLNHPGIVTIHSFEEVDGVLLIEMEYVAGSLLSAEITPGGMEVSRLLDLAEQLTEAVGAAHQAGLTHRDLKPGNVMLTPEGRVKLLDFGIAKLRDEPAPDRPEVSAGAAPPGGKLDTGAVFLVGTTAYMSPEQAEGRPLDHRSDIFSLGVMLHEMATGERPFAGKTVEERLDAIAHDIPSPVTEIRPALPEELAPMIARCLEKEPGKRYASLRELRDGIRALRERLAPVRPRPETRGNLPVSLTSFVGRASEIAEASERLESHRLVTLTGTAGCGTSRLALRVAEEARSSFAHGAWIVDLAPVSDPVSVPQTVASVFRLQERPKKDLEAVLLDYLEERDLLLVLDNCGHLLGTCARFVDSVLRRAPQVKILVTSREETGIAGESILHVDPLPLPPDGPLPPPDALAGVDSVRLFSERARMVRPEFTLREENAQEVADICRQVDGLPLAIELAAARMRFLSVRQIVERLRESFRFLTGGGRTAPGRQQTLEATLDWSHDLLEEKARILFRRLAVFPGGWTADGAEKVASGDGIEEGETLDILSRLAMKSLVEVDRRNGAVRYRFLRTVQQYAREKLLEAGEEERLRHRHRDYLVSLSPGLSLPGENGAGAIRWEKS